MKKLSNLCFLNFKYVLLFGLMSLAMGCADSYHSPSSQNAVTGHFGKMTSDFQSINENIFQPLCVRCHSGEKAPHKIKMSSYEEIVHSPVFPPLVVPGKPLESSLYKSVVTGKMPKKGPHLDDQALLAIYNWIQKGAYENQPPEEPPPCPEGQDCSEPCDGDEPCD